MKRLSRYSLRTILGTVAFIALALAAYSPVMRYLHWKEARNAFADWASQANRGDGKIHTYAMLNRGLDNATLNHSPKQGPFLVSNAEMRLALQANGETMMIFDPIHNPPDPNRFYTLPAEQWMSDVDSVLEEWDRWRNTEYPNGG